MWVPTFALSSLDPFLNTHSEDIYPLFSSFGGQIGKFFYLQQVAQQNMLPQTGEWKKSKKGIFW